MNGDCGSQRRDIEVDAYLDFLCSGQRMDSLKNVTQQLVAEAQSLKDEEYVTELRSRIIY